MSQATPSVSATAPAATPGASLPGLVNSLAQELAEARRALAAATQKLGTTSHALQGRTQELTQARTALALLLATLDSTTDGILAMGYFGRAMHYNARFIQMWRIPADQLPNLNDAALLAMQLSQVKDPAAFLALVGECKAQPDAEQTSVIELTDGRIFQCRVMPQRVRGKRIGAVTSFQDVTERERMARTLELLEAQVPREVAQARAAAYQGLVAPPTTA